MGLHCNSKYSDLKHWDLFNRCQATVGCYGYYLRLRPLTFDLQEIAPVKTHVGSQVNVSVDAAPSQDLNAAMTEIRKHYESVAVKNRKELEAWYQGKVSWMTKISLLYEVIYLKELFSKGFFFLHKNNAIQLP